MDLTSTLRRERAYARLDNGHVSLEYLFGEALSLDGAVGLTRARQVIWPLLGCRRLWPDWRARDLATP